jgi:hypothetical protein
MRTTCLLDTDEGAARKMIGKRMHGFIVLSLLYGYLAWRGSGRVWNGVLGAVVLAPRV